jgi:hypothetical protein
MQRRNFIRVLGGGVIMAAGASSAGCASAVPAEAILPWQGPMAETDVRRWVLAYAILAAHSHNLQSWVVDLGTPNEIVLTCDPTRLLPETDPLSRQIMMSHGTFLELLDIAARERGLRADITLFPQGAFGAEKIDARPVARIRLVADQTVVKDALFAQILKRRTNRSSYEPARTVPAEARQAMADAVAQSSVRFGFVGAEQSAALQRHRTIASEAWRIELTTPRTVMESYKVLRIGASEVAQHRDGLTIMDPKLVWMNRLGLFDRSQSPAPDSYATTSQIEEFNTKMLSTTSFMWIVSTGNDRVTQVNAGRAYARVQLAGTAHGVVMQPLSQALQEYPEQDGQYAAIHALLDAPTPMQTVQMWARVGFAPPVEPAPRRGVDAQIVRV